MASLPKFVQAVRIKNRVYHYFRRGRLRAKLHYAPGTPAFWAEYARLLASEEVKRENYENGTIGKLLEDYRRSPKYLRLAPETRSYYERQIDWLSSLAKFRVEEVQRRHLYAFRDHLASTPRTADQFIQVMSVVFQFAVKRDLIQKNPAADIERLNEEPISYVPWSFDECARFETAYAEGAVPVCFMTAYLLGRYIGQRRGDILALTWSAWDGAALTVLPRKTRRKKGTQTFVIPAHTELRAHLEQIREERSSLYLVPAPMNGSWNPRNFSKAFRATLDRIGLADRHLHGLRHLAASSLAEAGCSEHLIMSVTGHATSEMVQRYTRGANQATMAQAAINLLEQRDKRVKP